MLKLLTVQLVFYCTIIANVNDQSKSYSEKKQRLMCGYKTTTKAIVFITTIISAFSIHILNLAIAQWTNDSKHDIKNGALFFNAFEILIDLQFILL